MGLAAGATGVILYIACIIFMTIAGEGSTIFFFNSLLHGLDITPILRMNIPFLDTLLGIILTFILGWLTGILVAAIYNIDTSKKPVGA